MSDSIFNRRKFVIAAAATAGVLPSLSTVSGAVGRTTKRYKKKLVVLGTESDWVFQDNNHQSVVQVINLESFDHSQHVIPVPNAHSIVLAGKSIVCLPQHHNQFYVTNSLFDSGKVMNAPKGWELSGHGIYDLSEDRIVLTIRKKSRKTSNGGIALYDKDFKLISLIPLEGTDPHDVSIHPNLKKVAISYYGNSEYSDEFSSLADSKIEWRSLKNFNKISDVNFKQGSITHITLADNGDTFGVVRNSYPYTKDGFKLLEQKQLGQVVGLLDKIAGKILLPSYMVKWDGKRAIQILKPDQAIRGPQSIIHLENSDKVVSAWPFSQHVAVYDTGRDKWQIIRPELSGIAFPRGVADLGDGKTIAISDQFNGIALFNLKKNIRTAFLPISTFYNRHIYTIV